MGSTDGVKALGQETSGEKQLEGLRGQRRVQWEDCQLQGSAGSFLRVMGAMEAPKQGGTRSKVGGDFSSLLFHYYHGSCLLSCQEQAYASAPERAGGMGPRVT